MEKPSYFSILPANVRYDSKLKPNEKLLYSEITALSNKGGYCYASNKYFSDLYSVSKTSVSLWVKNLKELGYITVKTIYKEGSMEVEKRCISISNYPMQENLNTPLRKLDHPPQVNLKDNNIIIPPSDLVVNFINICLKDKLYVETFAITTKTNIYTIEQYLEKFNRHLIQVSKTHPNIAEYKNHFNNWVNRLAPLPKLYPQNKTELDFG
tara:strand:- start:2210 stop:2839 length:630 start_codon:yes stop_codon:yes gene_type:complete